MEEKLYNKREKIQRGFLKQSKSLLLSHHPECEEFGEEHTFKIMGVKFCIGCFFGYTSAVIGAFIIIFLTLIKLLDPTYFWLIGLILISTIVLSFIHLTKIKIIKIFQKILMGIGGAFLTLWPWTLPNSFYVNFTIFFILIVSYLGILNGYHGYSIYKTCKNCQYSLNWEKCPGFKDMINKIM